MLYCLLYIGFVCRQGLYHFFRPNYNYQVPFLFGETFSLRAIVVSKSFDLAIWFTYQLILIGKHPQRINLISKIPIEWKDDAGTTAADNLIRNMNIENKDNNENNIDHDHDKTEEVTIHQK